MHSEGRKEVERITLTKAEIAKLTPPEKGRRIVYDKIVPQFGVRITERGAKSFILYRRVDGRPSIFTIGAVGSLTLDKARNKAVSLNGEIADGGNPQTIKSAKKTEITLGEYWKEYYWPHHASMKTFAKDEQSKFDRHLKIWANRKLADITFQDVQNLHRRITKAAPIAANRLISLIHHLFAEAKRDGCLKGENPAAGIRKNREQHRERFLEPDEAPRFFEALASEENETFRDYVWLSILTGQRQGNICAMRFDEIDFKSATWAIPSHKTKSKNIIRVPLHPEAMQIIKARKDAGGGEYVLPGPGEAGHYTEPKRAWKSFVKRAGLEDFRPHDMRHTMGSWQAATGASQALVAKALGHKSVNTAAIYTQMSLDPVRASVNEAVDALLAVGKVKPQAEIIKMPGKKSKSGGT